MSAPEPVEYALPKASVPKSMSSAWKHRLKVERGACLWSQYWKLRQEDWCEPKVSQAMWWDPISKNTPEKQEQPRACIVYWLILSTDRLKNHQGHRCLDKCRRDYLYCIKQEGNTHINCRQCHSMGCEKKLIHNDICGMNEWVVTWHGLNQSYCACCLPVSLL